MVKKIFSHSLQNSTQEDLELSTKIIETINLQKKFGNIMAYDNINLTINKGEVFGLLGPNGAGKTTLIRTLVGLVNASNGNASIFGHNISNEIHEIRKRIAVLPQECQAYENLTAFENIYYFGKIHGTVPDDILRTRTNELLELIGLTSRKDDLVKKFSGGMKRKVLVARAMVVDPDLIFLDEPTTAIDIMGARTVRNLIRKLSSEKNVTILLTTHDLSEVSELCDRVGIMVNGQLVAIGTPSELDSKFKTANLEDVFVALVNGEIDYVQ